jgi:IPT/TIG domain
MRYVSLVLASLLTIGCGNSAKNNGDPFKAVIFSPPAIMTLTPDSVPVNSVPFTMTINGSNFGTDAVVFWNGTPLNTRFITSNQLMAALTDTDLSYWGMIPVYVRTGGMNSNTTDFNLSPQ